jgi:hypothetical protein
MLIQQNYGAWPATDIRAKVNTRRSRNESALLQRIAWTTDYDDSSSYEKYSVQTRKNSNPRFSLHEPLIIDVLLYIVKTLVYDGFC